MLLKFENESDWLEARKQDVSSTQVAALLGASPYRSRFALWHLKRSGTDADPFVPNNATKWGKRLQNVVALGICEDEGWQCEDLSFFYLRDPDLRIGASMDVKAICPNAGPGLLEIKTTAYFDESRGWFKDTAPVDYEMQLQTQMHLAIRDGQDIRWGAIGALDGRKEVRIYRRAYDPQFGQILDDEARKFWNSIAANDEPDPDYKMDAALIRLLQGPIKVGVTVDLSKNNNAHRVLEDYLKTDESYKAVKKQSDALDEGRKALKTELHHLAGPAEAVIIGGTRIGMKETTIAPRQQDGYSFRRFDVKTSQVK